MAFSDIETISVCICKSVRRPEGAYVLYIFPHTPFGKLFYSFKKWSNLFLIYTWVKLKSNWFPIICMFRYKNTQYIHALYFIHYYCSPVCRKKFCDMLQCGTDRWHFSQAYFQANGHLMPGALSLLTSHITEESNTFWPHYYAQTLIGRNPMHIENVLVWANCMKAIWQ